MESWRHPGRRSQEDGGKDSQRLPEAREGLSRTASRSSRPCWGLDFLLSSARSLWSSVTVVTRNKHRFWSYPTESWGRAWEDEPWRHRGSPEHRHRAKWSGRGAPSAVNTVPGDPPLMGGCCGCPHRKAAKGQSQTGDFTHLARMLLGPPNICTASVLSPRQNHTWRSSRESAVKRLRLAQAGVGLRGPCGRQRWGSSDSALPPHGGAVWGAQESECPRGVAIPRLTSQGLVSPLRMEGMVTGEAVAPVLPSAAPTHSAAGHTGWPQLTSLPNWSSGLQSDGTGSHNN